MAVWLGVCMLLVGLFASAGDVGAQARPPNIVILLADDLGWGDVGFNGRKEWKTPHLDRLARQGTLFKRWYTAGVTCAPSRAALLTGRYGIHNGVSGNGDDLPRDEVTIAEALKPKGYVTGLFGKWHRGATRPGETSFVHPMDQGFDEFFGFTSATDAWEKYPAKLWEGREEKPAAGYADTLFANRAIEFIERHRHRPFLLYVPFTNPHFHVRAPAEDAARFLGHFADDEGEIPAKAHYAAMIERLDTEVGRIVDAIDHNELGRNTLILFTSDHGATFEAGNRGASAFHDSNAPFRGQKRSLWEGGIRVPGIARWTGKLPARTVSNQAVHMIDVFPTIAQTAGCEVTAFPRLDGVSQLENWITGAALPERTLFWEWRSEGTWQVAAMRGERKLVATGDQAAELFDVVLDPAERKNLRPAEPDLSARLLNDLKAWLETESEASKLGKPSRGQTRLR